MSADRPVLNLALVAESQVKVRDLAGFRKSHRVPDGHSDQTQNFVWKIAVEDLNRDLDERFAEFREHFRFKRAQLTVQDPDKGSGAIVTPWFVYQVTVSHSADDPAGTVWRRQVAEFEDPDALLSTEFGKVFGRLFDTVEFQPPAPIDMEDFIDTLEDRDDETIKLEYDRSASWCELYTERIPGCLLVECSRIALTTNRPELPARLLEAFFAFRNELTGLECF